MKIAMIGQKGIPALFGGIERHVEEVSCCLVKKMDLTGSLYQVFVYARSYYTPKTVKKHKKVNVIHLPSIRTKHLDTITHVFLASWHAVFKLKPDVIHYHGVGPALCLWIPKLFSPQTKVIFTFHCQDYFHQKWGKFAQLSLKAGEMIGCYLADEIIPVSVELEKYIKIKYNQSVKFIPHGVNREKNIPAKSIKRWGLKKNNYILAVSRLIRHKGLHYLIKANKKIDTEKKLVIVGPAFYTQDYEKELKKIAKDNPKILFLGAQQGKILKELFSNAYVFVNPSEQEGLSLAVMEAGSFGNSLILSKIQSHQDMFGNLPFFFKNKSVKDLKNKLRLILDNSSSSYQRGVKIQKYCKQNYNWNEVVEKITLKYV